MQSLEVISVNIWQVLISLLNLVILFLLMKKFLFKPVKKVLDQRRADLDKDYEQASLALEEAERQKNRYEAVMAGAEQSAAQVLADAARKAEYQSSSILSEAREKAVEIRRQAETDAALEHRRAAEEIRSEIAGLSAQLTGKLLEREVSAADHQQLIDSFLQEIGTDENTNQ